MTRPEAQPRDEEAVNLFVERMAMAFVDVGFPRMAARVLFTVMSADEPLTAAEIGERLGVSPAAISGAVRYLTSFSILVREPVPRSRRDRYRIPDHAWYTATVTKSAFLHNFAELAGQGADALGPETPAGRRMAEMHDFFSFVQQETLTMVERWQATRKGDRDDRVD